MERTASALLAWSRWRRWHQAWARYHHYRRRAHATPQPPGIVQGRATQVQDRPGDVDDACWARLDVIIPHPKPGGPPKGYTRRQFAEAYAYLLQEGCSWRALPPTFPPWHTVYERVRQWQRAGVLEQIWGILCAGGPRPNAAHTAVHSDELQL